MRSRRHQQQLDSIRRGIAEIEAGHYIPHQAMKIGLLSLGLDHELPLPKCICGKTHGARGKARGASAGFQARPKRAARGMKHAGKGGSLGPP
jgi:hypothetical protein